MGKIISITNHKGGVAKTTTTINFGAALVQLGKRVLLVDVDPQCNLTETLWSGDYADSVYSCMLEGRSMAPLCIREGLDLVPGDKGMLSADVRLSSPEFEGRSQLLLKAVLAPLKDRYDYVIIDTPPSRGLITVNALAASDEVVIPTLAEILAVRGMKDISELIGLVRSRLNPGLRIAGLLLVMYGDRTTAARKTAVYIEGIAGFLNTRVFSTRIRKNVAVVESQMAGRDLFVESPDAKAAQDYLALAKEYLSI